MSIQLTRRQVGDVLVIHASGRITLGEGSVTLREEVRDVTSRGSKKILLDLGDTSYIDSSGAGELEASNTYVQNHGGQLKLLNLTKRIQNMSQIIKLSMMFEVFNDEVKAIKSFE